MKIRLIAALLAGSALTQAVPAYAQAADHVVPHASDATADAAIANTKAVDAAEAKIELLQAQVEALQAAIEQIKADQAKVTPSWKGAPVVEDKSAGFSFKPKGLIQFDAGYNGYPNGNELRGSNGGLDYGNLGWNGRARRLTLGADGTLPGGFRYSAEFNFAQGSVDYEDVLLAYDFKESPASVQVGYFYPFSSLETMTSSKYTSFLERAGITDAFNHNRRLGIAIVANDKKSDSWVVQGGLFNEPINNTSFTHTGWEAAIRAVYSPMLGSTRLHLGANFQHRENTREALGARYRSRPFNQLTDQRFIDTGMLASKSDDVAGVELGAIVKSLHFAAEAQQVWVHGTFDAAELAAQNADPTSNATASGAALNGNPKFWGGYAEAGYYLTGETRTYKGGSFGRVKVLKPFNQGGWGAIQINGRVEHLNLGDRVDDSSPAVGAPFFVNGGTQTGYLASLIWNPTDYVRFMAQYGHINVTGGPRAATVDPTSTKPVNRRTFSSDNFAVRAQVDF